MKFAIAVFGAPTKEAPLGPIKVTLRADTDEQLSQVLMGVFEAMDQGDGVFVRWVFPDTLDGPTSMMPKRPTQ